MARERSRTFESDLLRLGNGATDGFEIPWLTQWIAESRLSPGELDLLLERVRDQTWQFTGVNLVDLIVGSQWDYDHIQGRRAKYKANDEIDRWRAAVALCWSDLLITDGPAATLLKSSNASAFTTSIVYSVRDVDAILQLLTDATSSAPHGHAPAVAPGSPSTPTTSLPGSPLALPPSAPLRPPSLL